MLPATLDQSLNDVLWLGHSKAVIRSDNELALAKVMEKTVRALELAGIDGATTEGSVPYDPQANGHAGSTVGVVKSMSRTLLLGLERHIEGRGPLTHLVLALLVSHAAHVRNMRLVGSDGWTSQQRVRGNSSVPALRALGELCRYKMSSGR